MCERGSRKESEYKKGAGWGMEVSSLSAAQTQAKKQTQARAREPPEDAIDLADEPHANHLFLIDKLRQCNRQSKAAY